MGASPSEGSSRRRREGEETIAPTYGEHLLFPPRERACELSAPFLQDWEKIIYALLHAREPGRFPRAADAIHAERQIFPHR